MTNVQLGWCLDTTALTPALDRDVPKDCVDIARFSQMHVPTCALPESYTTTALRRTYSSRSNAASTAGTCLSTRVRRKLAPLELDSIFFLLRALAVPLELRLDFDNTVQFRIAATATNTSKRAALLDRVEYTAKLGKPVRIDGRNCSHLRLG